MSNVNALDKNIPTVADLRRSGFKVRVSHNRYFKSNFMGGFKIRLSPYTRFTENRQGVLPKGGETTVEITDPNGVTVFGTSVCRPDEAFVKRLGLSVSIGRALKQLNK